MTLRHLRIFVTVCEEGSITKAGQKLFMAQPTVSFAISELERHYNTKLFDRISKRLYLTDAGRRLLPYAQHITSMFEEMEAEIQDWNRGGVLRVGTSITIGNCLLPQLLKTFAKQRPDVAAKVQIHNSEQIEQLVLDNQVDIGLIEGVSHSSMVVSQPFWEDDLVLLCAPEHRWAHQSSIQPEALKEEHFMMRESGSGGRAIFESALLLMDIELEPAWVSISTQAIIQAVINGFGVAVLPRLLVENELVQGTLVAKPIEGISLKRKMTILHHKKKYLTDAAQDFIRMCLAFFSETGMRKV